MKTLRIPLKRSVNESYKIYCGEGILASLPLYLKKKKYGKKYVIITDSTVKKLYAEKLQKHLKKHGITSFIIPFPAGEKSKNLQTVEKICSQMNLMGIERGDCVIALGGGVTGDIAGFVASIYRRGIPFIQCPSTLLAMTDSSIGGKTGVDMPEGKNMIGTFTQPEDVFIDIALLVSLPEVELLNGMAEIVKHAVIADKGLFRFIEKNTREILNLDPKKIMKMLVRSITVKKKIVEADPHEQSIRAFLNYGHTIGHALEQVSEYEIPHGQGVAIGMVLINAIARKYRVLSEKNCNRINTLLYKLGLPNTIPKKYKTDAIYAAMTRDKKVANGELWYIIPRKIGKVGLTKDITQADVVEAITNAYS